MQRRLLPVGSPLRLVICCLRSTRVIRGSRCAQSRLRCGTMTIPMGAWRTFLRCLAAGSCRARRRGSSRSAALGSRRLLRAVELGATFASWRRLLFSQSAAVTMRRLRSSLILGSSNFAIAAVQDKRWIVSSAVVVVVTSVLVVDRKPQLKVVIVLELVLHMILGGARPSRYTRVITSIRLLILKTTATNFRPRVMMVA